MLGLRGDRGAGAFVEVAADPGHPCSISRSTHRPADGSSPTAITRYLGRLNNVLTASRGEPIRSAMARGPFTVRVSRQHESQQIHGPPTSYDTGPDFTRNREEPLCDHGVSDSGVSVPFRVGCHSRASSGPHHREVVLGPRAFTRAVWAACSAGGTAVDRRLPGMLACAPPPHRACGTVGDPIRAPGPVRGRMPLRRDLGMRHRERIVHPEVETPPAFPAPAPTHGATAWWGPPLMPTPAAQPPRRDRRARLHRLRRAGPIAAGMPLASHVRVQRREAGRCGDPAARAERAVVHDAVGDRHLPLMPCRALPPHTPTRCRSLAGLGRPARA